MRLVWLVLIKIFAVSSGSSEPSSDCENWPTQQDDLKKCCALPNHFNYEIQGICQTNCSSIDQKFNYECFIDCYVNSTGLVKNGKADKTVIKLMYAENFYFVTWEEIIKTGIEKCELESSGSLADKLLKYFNCLDSHLAASCVTFILSKECSSVELRFENCHGGVKYNCTAWPVEINMPIDCCLPPQLVTPNMTETCRLFCKEKEIFDFRRIECEHNCTWAETGIMASDGTIDYTKVKLVLIKNSNKSVNWEKSIENAVENCQKTPEEAPGQGEMQIQIKMMKLSVENKLEQCIFGSLSERCVQFSEDFFCRKVKSYIEHCPDTKPQRMVSINAYIAAGNQKGDNGPKIS